MHNMISTNRMTSMEIAEITGKQHCHISRDIKDEIEKLEKAGIDTQSKFGLRERDGLTGKIPYYELTREGVLQLAARYDAVVRAKLIDLAMESEKQQPVVQELSPQLQVLISLELEQKKIKEEISEVKTTLFLVKDTVANHPEENWRDTINRMFNRIVKSVGNEKFQDLRNESYSLLECRANCDLSTRLRNYRKRLEEAGETKTKINKANKLDVIESDSKLKEIYTGIIKELTIKHVA